MRFLLLAMGACVFALNLAGCSCTGTCGGGLSSGAALSGGCTSCATPASDCGCGSATDATTNCGCQKSRGLFGGGMAAGSCGCASTPKCNGGGRDGLGLRLFEAGPSCKAKGCNGGCNTCQRAKLIQRPIAKGRLRGALQQLGSCRSCGSASSDCGCSGSMPAAPVAVPSADCGCSDCASGGCASAAAAPAPAVVADAGCGSCGDTCGGTCGNSDVETVGFTEGKSGGLLSKFGIGSRTKGARGCGVSGCGLGGKLCNGCRSGRIGSRVGNGAIGCGRGGCGRGGALCGSCLASRRGSIPHRQPQMGPGAGQIPSYAYPYYTTRAPRDFLMDNPPTIGY